MVHCIAIVSLSSGVLGESFVSHELPLGLKRLEEYGLKVKFMDNTLKGMAFLKDHPEARAADLLQAFADPEADMILTAIGGDDTYRLLPYLFDHGELASVIRPKIFMGFSDTTTNHFMLHKLGLNSFYGQAFLTELCELGPEMLPYSRRCFEELITTGTISEIRPSEVWYRTRESFGPEQLGTALQPQPNGGFELLQGAPVFSGEILGGCLDTIFDWFDPGRYADSPALCRQYGLFPAAEDWAGKILLLETSEEKMTPEQYRKELTVLKETGVFEAVSGVLAGKPMDECYAAEYRAILPEVIARPELPIVWNVNVGHALPRCIIPFGVPATVNVDEQVIRFHKG